MDINNFVKVMYNEVYSIPTSLEKPKKELKEKKGVKIVEVKKDKVQDNKKPEVNDKSLNIAEKKPEIDKNQRIPNNTDVTLMKILNTVDYTIEGIDELYSHERYKYKENYRKKDFERINYHRDESCGPDNKESIYSSMRDNKIFCEYEDYIGKNIIAEILDLLGLKELESSFVINNVNNMKNIIEVTDKKLRLLGLNEIDIDRYRKIVKDIIFKNKIKVFQSRKKACNCEYERFLKNMVYRDRFSEVEQGHVKPFKEARDMCERCFRYEQEILSKGYIDDKMSVKQTIEYINDHVFDKVEKSITTNKYKLENKEEKLDSAIDDIWFNRKHPKGFKRTISYEDFRDRIHMRKIKERQFKIREKLRESIDRLINKKKRKVKIMDELYNINKQKRKILDVVTSLKSIVDKYRKNRDLYIELKKNGKVTGIDVEKDLKEIEKYINITIPNIMERYSLLNNLKKIN